MENGRQGFAIIITIPLIFSIKLKISKKYILKIYYLGGFCTDARLFNLLQESCLY